MNTDLPARRILAALICNMSKRELDILPSDMFRLSAHVKSTTLYIPLLKMYKNVLHTATPQVKSKYWQYWCDDAFEEDGYKTSI